MRCCRFDSLVEALFDLAVPYALWSRGYLTIAADLFKIVVEKEKSG